MKKSNLGRLLGFLAGLLIAGEAFGAPVLSGFDVSPYVVLEGGSTATFKVTVSEACPAEGCAVTMYQSSSYLVLPSTILIPAGATSASASVLVGNPSEQQYFTLPASFNGVYKYLQIWINPKVVGPVMTSANLSSSYVYSGQILSLNANFSEACPAEGCNLSLYSNYQQLIALPYNLLVPAGYTSATYNAKAGNVTYATLVLLSVGFKSNNQYFQVLVFPVIAPNADGSYTMWAYGSSTRTGTGSVTKSRNIQQALSNMNYHYSAFVTKQCQAAIPGGVLVKVGSPIGKGEFRNSNGLLQYEYTQKAICKRQ